MGLTLHYEFRLPETKSADDVDRILTSMHAHATTLPFAEVSPLVSLQRTAQWTPEHDASRSWLEFWAPIIAEPHGEDAPSYSGDLETARGFMVNPGDGCETATFGFLLRSDEARSHSEWFWYCSCKTQYASNVSDAHFVTCHTALVALLDHTASLGVEVSVLDEGGYWETRDDKALVGEVLTMNRIIAAFGGRLADALGSPDALQAPIFSHPRFERLEMGE